MLSVIIHMLSTFREAGSPLQPRGRDREFQNHPQEALKDGKQKGWKCTCTPEWLHVHVRGGSPSPDVPHKEGTFCTQAPSLPAQVWLMSDALSTQTSATGLVPWRPRKLGPASQALGCGITQTRLSPPALLLSSPLIVLSSWAYLEMGYKHLLNGTSVGFRGEKVCECGSGSVPGCLVEMRRPRGLCLGRPTVDPHTAWCSPFQESSPSLG